MTITQALALVMADVSSVGKGDKNDHFGFMFRGVDRVINAVGPALRTHGVVVLPELRNIDTRDVTNDKGKTSREVTLTVAYTFHGPEGDSLVCVVPGEAQDTGDKAVSKAMSVAWRTALIQALAIPTQGADPDSQTYTRGESLLNAWKTKILGEAKKREWDVDTLAFEFNSWNQGGDIREANADLLQKFYESLVPPATRTVQRSKPAGDK